MTDKKPPFILYTQSSHNLGNNHVCRTVAGYVFTVAHAAYEGRLCSALMMAEKPYNFYPELDGRTAEAKALQAAEREMYDAISRFDTARAAAHEKARMKSIAKRRAA